MITCPWCGAVQDMIEALLGALGNRMHYRCRYCGGDWSRLVKTRKRRSRS